MVPGLDAAGLTTLLEELLDHAEGDAEALGDLFTRAFDFVIRANDAFTQIKRECSHASA
jgi:hypothetical protein